MPPIPDRWIPYKACGNVIDGTRLICFKVPLQKKVQAWNKEIKEIWDIPALIKNVPKLGAVIDLTNTARYYKPAELQAAGILHKKILMPGRIIPPENKVTEFMDTVDEFLRKDCELLIGVHCTHGLNRTGYMVCRYMRDRLGVPAKDAIKKFEKARGYQIERKNYIADILGHPPPSPELGKETDIKPVIKRHTYKHRSPLAEDDEDATQERERSCDRTRDRYSRHNNRSNSRFNNRRNYGDNNRSGWSRKSKGDNETNRRNISDSDGSTSYNFKHDY